MQSLFQQIKSGQLWDFHGGIHPPARKQQTSQKPIGRLSLPERLYIPIRQHIGVPGSVIVTTGQKVLKGQPLTFADNAMAVPVHAPTSGTVLAIESHIAPHPSALPETCVVIEPDGLEQWRERHPINLIDADRLTILQRIQESGIAGMGGAGFPTHLKTGAASGVDYLIVNAVECEPYISADDALMQEFATTIVKGIDILCELLGPAAVLIGIEDDKPDAIAAMQAACSQREQYLVKVVPAKYPSGGEKQLIQLLTSKEVPAGRRPLDIGIVMQNVGTVFAIAQAVLEDIPLISRIVTVVGESLSRPQNVLALIGTPVGYLLDACGFSPEPSQRVIMGGPMMGFTLPSVSVPLVKTTNCVLAPSQAELPPAQQEMDCIRCGACAEVCPAVLLPQQLLWYSKAKDQDKLKEYNLADCIECGACAYVCPSEIPLVHYYRVAKAEIREQTRDELKAEQAKARFEARNQRLEEEKQQRAARNQALAMQRQQLMAEQQKSREIELAQQRVAVTSEQTAELTKEQIIALREQKKAQARAYQAEKAAQSSPLSIADDNTVESRQVPTDVAAAAASSPATGNEASGADPRSAAVAAAIARAKAKKAHTEPAFDASVSETAQIQADNVETVGESVDKPVADPRAAAVAAAIARAKAKKAQAETASDVTMVELTSAKTNNAEPVVESVDKPVTAPIADPKAAAVAAAIARAKAKKAQAASNTESSPSTIEATDSIAVLSTTAEHQVPESIAAKTTIAETAVETPLLEEHQAAAQSSFEQAPMAEQLGAELAKRKALAAAIAKAQAKRQQLATESSMAVQKSADLGLTAATEHPTEETATTASVQVNVSKTPSPAPDARKAAIAAAIAKAKAKQQQLAGSDPKDQA